MGGLGATSPHSLYLRDGAGGDATSPVLGSLWESALCLLRLGTDTDESKKGDGDDGD